MGKWKRGGGGIGIFARAGFSSVGNDQQVIMITQEFKSPGGPGRVVAVLSGKNHDYTQLAKDIANLGYAVFYVSSTSMPFWDAYSQTNLNKNALADLPCGE